MKVFQYNKNIYSFYLHSQLYHKYKYLYFDYEVHIFDSYLMIIYPVFSILILLISNFNNYGNIDNSSPSCTIILIKF